MSAVARVTDVITPAHGRYDIVVMECDGYICFWETGVGRVTYPGEIEVTDVVHQCPPIPVTDGISPPPPEIMPCCGRTSFEVPRDDRITLDPALATCSGTAS